MVELGDRVKDSITGFEGIAWSWVRFLTGCDRIGILPREMSEKGTLKELEYFDLPRVEVLKKQEVVFAQPEKLPAAKPKEGPGGMEVYPKNHDPR